MLKQPFLQCCDITAQNHIMVERTIFKFIWNKKWYGKCPNRIQRQVMKNSFKIVINFIMGLIDECPKNQEQVL